MQECICSKKKLYVFLLNWEKWMILGEEMSFWNKSIEKNEKTCLDVPFYLFFQFIKCNLLSTIKVCSVKSKVETLKTHQVAKILGSEIVART